VRTLLIMAAMFAATPALTAPVGTWAYAGKTGIGTSYEAYTDGRYVEGGRSGHLSKLWFSIAQGHVTETMWGRIDQAQLQSLRVMIGVDGAAAVGPEALETTTSYLDTDAAGRPRALAYRLFGKDRAGRFTVEQHVFTDPDRDTLFVRVTVRALRGRIAPYLLATPHMRETSGHDIGHADAAGLYAGESEAHLAIVSGTRFVRSGAGVTAAGLDALNARSATGEVVLAAAYAPLKSGESATYDVALGFGRTEATAVGTARGTLDVGYTRALAAYERGWEGYLAGLTELPSLYPISTDNGRLANVSAMALKAMEDKTYAGALIASLSIPWGDTVPADIPASGYKAVWPRDFYQCAMALLALGDRETPRAAFAYLRKVQVRAETPGNRGASGWFQQKSHVDGTAEWSAVQLDQTAMPVLLGHRLAALGVLSPAELDASWRTMLKPAADFLANGGAVDLNGNRASITPPKTQQERWEEQGGYSPSTTAAVIAGLAAAADIADRVGDAASAKRYRAAADADVAGIERTTVVPHGRYGDGYFLRIAPTGEPAAHTSVPASNGQPALDQQEMLDAGFLELVRYGVRRADDPTIVRSLAALDSSAIAPFLRVRYTFGSDGRWPGFRRYGGDGYGEDAVTGANWNQSGQSTSGQRGHVWPIFTGERGHYELARLVAKPGGATPAGIAQLRAAYVAGMESFANAGLMLPEQVWDGVGTPGPHEFVKGQGTDSATPLAWSHAEYIKLLRSLRDGQVWDRNAAAATRYAASTAAAR